MQIIIQIGLQNPIQKFNHFIAFVLCRNVCKRQIIKQNQKEIIVLSIRLNFIKIRKLFLKVHFSMDKSTTLKDFQTLTKLGQGAFGQVFKVKRKIDGQIYAMKKIKLAAMKQKQRENALNQVRILASYNGDFIIGFKESFFDDATSTLCIVMEFASGGDLLKLTQNHTKNRTKFGESQIWKALVNITEGLRILHQKKILHRDLKCANVFVTGQGIYKLGDLNVSKVLKKDMAQTQTGTPYYASPEVWKDRPYGVKSDMWSLGCVLYEMAAQKPPFTATDLPGLYKKICAGYFNRIPANYSNDLAKVISNLLKQNPSQRPSAIQLLQNPMVHKNYSGTINFKPKQQEQDDFLLKTLKVNHGNLPSIKNILPKANYDGQLKSSRCRANSIERVDRVKTESKDAQKPVQKLTEKQTPKIQRSQSTASIKQRREKQQKLIDNYLEIKKRHEEKQRQRQIQQLKNEKDNLIRKRQRVLSACGMRSNHPSSLEDSPKKRLEQKPNNGVAMTPSVNKKDQYMMPPSSNKILPPKPVQNNGNNVNYKLPPKPTPLIASKQNNSVDYSRPYSSRQKAQLQVQEVQRERSKQNLIRAGQQILNEDNLKSPKITDNSPKNRIVRSNSAQKVVYPSWWMD